MAVVDSLVDRLARRAGQLEAVAEITLERLAEVERLVRAALWYLDQIRPLVERAADPRERSDYAAAWGQLRVTLDDLRYLREFIKHALETRP